MVKILGEFVRVDFLIGEDLKGCVVDVFSNFILDVLFGFCLVVLGGVFFSGDFLKFELSLFRKFFVVKVIVLGFKFFGG